MNHPLSCGCVVRSNDKRVWLNRAEECKATHSYCRSGNKVVVGTRKFKSGKSPQRHQRTVLEDHRPLIDESASPARSH